MSKVKSFDKNMYPSVYDAIYEIMDKHMLVFADNPIFHAKALEEACFFLAENDIQHQYTIIPAPAGAECDEIISLMWVDGASYGNEVWYSRGKAFPKNHYRVSLVVAAENNEEIVNWISNIDEVDVCDWSVEDV
jgi:hypothetical protein